MSTTQARRGLWLDPRTKLFLLFLCVLSAAMAPSLHYELLVVALVACYGISCRRVGYSLAAAGVYVVLYFLTMATLRLHGGLQVMLIAFFSLVHKVYPCGILAGIILSTTKIGEFLSAMNRSHVPRKVVIPIAVMLRYAPTIREDWRSIRDAMRMRDVSPSLKSLFTHPGMTMECIYVPLMMAASKAADELTVASVTRGIENPAPRTSFVQIGFGPADVIFGLLFLGVFLVGQLCRGWFL